MKFPPAPRLDVRANTPTLEWLLAGGVYDHTIDDIDFVSHVQRAHLIAVDPGDPVGVALFPYDLTLGIELYEMTAESFTKGLVKFPDGLDIDVVCETPLKGANMVYDEHPWKVRGFVEYWHQAAHAEHGGMFVPVSVQTLVPARNLITCPPVASGNRHARDAFAYGVVALAMNADLRLRLEAAA